MKMNLLIVGATGAVGQEVLHQALAAPQISSVIAVTRRALDAAIFPPHKKLNIVVVDFNDLEKKPSWCEVDAVICTLGTTIKVAGSKAAFAAIDLDLPVAIARMAKAAGATRFGLNSSLGAKASSNNFYLRTKGQAEAQIEALHFASLTIVRPSLIDAEREHRRPGEQAGLLMAKIFQPLIPRQYLPISAARIARALLAGVVAGRLGTQIIESRDLHGEIS